MLSRTKKAFETCPGKGIQMQRKRPVAQDNEHFSSFLDFLGCLKFISLIQTFDWVVFRKILITLTELLYPDYLSAKKNYIEKQVRDKSLIF
ncbi:MAG: hypothetical protein C4519_21900 [Desulfobacteraceae bacterium]|nr:MAG: hypothetical protein C4519_21900 [Desulfobacteraceae bacterium]